SYLAAYKPSLILIALFCPLTGLPMMLLPVHLVLLEMIQHPLTALAFEGDQAPGVMDLPPRPASAPLLSQSQVVRSLISGFILAAGVLFFYALRLNHSLPYARSAGLAVFMVGNLFLVWASRADDKPWNSSFLFNNSRFWLVAGLTALSFPIFLEIPALASLLQAERLAPIDWLWAFLISFASVGWRVFGFFSRKQTQKEKAAAS
ncbi:MAG TPA: cation transporting ATPase C-terminal domain-containing protein, partial [bacterium]